MYYYPDGNNIICVLYIFRCDAWIAALKRKDLAGSKGVDLVRRGLRICEDHFSPDCFANILLKHRLNCNAVPYEVSSFINIIYQFNMQQH
jgi:hypothetical protein